MELEGVYQIKNGEDYISMGPAYSNPELLDFGVYGSYEYASTKLDQRKLKVLISLLQTYVKD